MRVHRGLQSPASLRELISLTVINISLQFMHQEVFSKPSFERYQQTVKLG